MQFSTKLFPMLLALTGMQGFNKPGDPQGNQLAPGGGAADAGVNLADPWGANNPGLNGQEMDPMQMDPSSMNFGAGSVGGMGDLEGQNAPQALAETDDPSFDPNAQQTTEGPDLQQMLAFMQQSFDKKCQDMMQQMQQMMMGQQAGGADMPPPEMQDELAASGGGGGGGGGGAPALAMNAAAPAPTEPAPVAPQALATQPPVTDQSPPVVPQAPAATTTPPVPQSTGPAKEEGKVGDAEATSKPTSGSHPTKTAVLDGGGSYTHHLVNNSKEPMDIAYFKNLGEGPRPGFDGSSLTVHLEPGQSADVSIPDNWQGRAQKFSGKMDDPATWAEFNNEPADASKGRTEAKTWFDVSKITGANASLTMKTGDGVTAGADGTGSLVEAAKKLPNAANILTKDKAGNDVIRPAQGFDGKTNKDVVDFLTKYEPQKSQDVGGTANGKYDNYILPNNDSATRTTNKSKEMTLTFGDL